MYQVDIVTGNPNKKIGTFAVSRTDETPSDLLGSFQKIMIPKDSDLIPYSPLAHNVLTRKAFNGRDIYSSLSCADDNGKTIISIAKGWEWNDEARANVCGILQKFFDRNIPAFYLDAIERDIDARKAYGSNDAMVKTLLKVFEQVVNPVLQKDGGAMEIIEMKRNPDGAIVTELMLLGSCNGCSASETRTLADAFRCMNDAVNMMKEQNPHNAEFQKTTVSPFIISDKQELVLKR